jgi:hypothetical protein
MSYLVRKYALSTKVSQILEVNENSKVLDVILIDDIINLLILVNPYKATVKRTFKVIQTGVVYRGRLEDEHMNTYLYVGSVQMKNSIVYSIFEDQISTNT